MSANPGPQQSRKRSLLKEFFPPIPAATKQVHFEDSSTGGFFKDKDFWPYIWGVFQFGALIVVPMIASQHYEQNLFASIFCAWIFVQGTKKNGLFHWVWYLIWLFVFVCILIGAWLWGDLSKGMFGGGEVVVEWLTFALYHVVIGFPIMFVCGWIGIMIGSLIPNRMRYAMPAVCFFTLFFVPVILVEALDRVMFISPGWFCLAAIAPWFWWLHASGFGRSRSGRSIVSLFVRYVLLGLFIMLLAEPRSVRKSDAMSVVFLVDQSMSISRDMSEQVMGYVAKVVGEKPEKDEAGLVAFGRNAAVQLPPSMSFALDLLEVTIQIDRNGTDVAKGLSLASAILPEHNQGRVVLISDGTATEGNLEPVLDDLKSRGVAVDVIEVGYDHEHEVVVERLELPRFVKKGEKYNATVIVNSLSDGEGELTLVENDRAFSPIKVKYKAGKNRFTIPIDLRESGYYEYAAELIPSKTADGKAKDGYPENNKAISFLHLKGEGKVMLVTDTEGNKKDWESVKLALEESKRQVEVKDAFDFPTEPLSLLPYDAILFINVPRDAFIDNQLTALKDAVTTQGTGFMMVGGENSFGPGGYHKTAIEEVLPVSMDITQKKILPKGALAIILHTCEFPQGNTWAKRITKQAIRVLNRQDEAGVLAYDWNGGDKWLFNLTPVSDFPRMAKLVNNAQIGDMPAFGPTMNLALKGLQQSDAAAKHMIIISDGDPQPPAPGVLKAYQAAGITISTVPVFPHGASMNTMTLIARSTGGRAYPALSNPGDEKKLPAIFIKEARTLKRSLIKNVPKGLVPKQNFPSDALKGIESMPKLYGYVVTTPKGGTNMMVLNAPGTEEDEPILSLGKFGVGTGAAFTSDLAPNWGKDWVQWEKYRAFVKQLTGTISRKYKQTQLRMQTYATGSKGTILIEDYAPESSFLNIQSKIIDPNGDEKIVTLKQTGPRRYEGKFDLSGEGRYQVMSIGGGQDREERLHGGFVVPYSQEYLRFRSNPILLKKIADKTGGRILNGDETGKDVYGVKRTPTASSRPIFDWFLVLLALLVPLDVAIRRVQIDLDTLKGWFGRARTHKPSDETFSQLLRAKKTAEQDIIERTGEAGLPPTGYEIPTEIGHAGPTIAQKLAAGQKTDEGDGTSMTERLLAAKRKAQQDQENQDDA